MSENVLFLSTTYRLSCFYTAQLSVNTLLGLNICLRDSRTMVSSLKVQHVSFLRHQCFSLVISFLKRAFLLTLLKLVLSTTGLYLERFLSYDSFFAQQVSIAVHQKLLKNCTSINLVANEPWRYKTKS